MHPVVFSACIHSLGISHLWVARGWISLRHGNQEWYALEMGSEMHTGSYCGIVCPAEKCRSMSKRRWPFSGPTSSFNVLSCGPPARCIVDGSRYCSHSSNAAMTQSLLFSVFSGSHSCLINSGFDCNLRQTQKQSRCPHRLVYKASLLQVDAVLGSMTPLRLDK